ncbi:unnamed protein product, partial [Rotaria sp. Silwood1]
SHTISSYKHRYDQSAMVIILTYFFFQGNKGTWSDQKLNDPAPYDMFTSVQKNLGDISRGNLTDGKNLALFNDYCDEKINCALSNMICKENKCKCITTNKQVYFWTGKRCVECIHGWHSFYDVTCYISNEEKTSTIYINNKI